MAVWVIMHSPLPHDPQGRPLGVGGGRVILVLVLFSTMRQTPLLLGAEADLPATQLPGPWREWAEGWSWVRPLAVDELVNRARSAEPVELIVSFPEDRVDSLRREIRVATVGSASFTWASTWVPFSGH